MNNTLHLYCTSLTAGKFDKCLHFFCKFSPAEIWRLAWSFHTHNWISQEKVLTLNPTHLPELEPRTLLRFLNFARVISSEKQSALFLGLLFYFSFPNYRKYLQTESISREVRWDCGLYSWSPSRKNKFDIDAVLLLYLVSELQKLGLSGIQTQDTFMEFRSF
jgi:hypothetical protein